MACRSAFAIEIDNSVQEELPKYTKEERKKYKKEFGFDIVGAMEDHRKFFTGFEDEVSLATRNKTPIKNAPGIVTVIRAFQIKEMGARTLADVLKTVPGFDISMDGTGEKEIAVRGILDKGSSKVKLLIDGHSVNEPGEGGASFNFSDLVVDNIEKIEIIRGPGSALYGQNAFLAVINVITKEVKDIYGFEWTARGGAFDTKNYSLLFGKEIKHISISGFFDYLDTEGHSEEIEQDIIFTDPASMTPGRSQNEKEKVDLNLKLAYKGLDFKGKYMKKRWESYIGNDDALNDDTMWRNTYIFGDLSYKFDLSDKLNMTSKVYYDQYNTDPFVEVAPEGYLVYPDGIRGAVRVKYRTIGFENQFNYNVFKGNDLTFGLQYEWMHQGDIHYSANFDPLTFAPLSSLTDFSNTFPFARRATRQIWSLYLQDEWNITDDINLTVGVRHDRFTRFGGTTNPRMGLIWRFMDDAHLKLLLATAFRAPNFNEMFFINNPVEIGNPNLDPEQINTFEYSMGYNFTKDISVNVNYFYNRIRDRIVLDTGSPRKWQNSGGSRVMGVEAELKAYFGLTNYFYANYTYQDAEDTRTRDRLHDVPVHKGNIGANVGITDYVNANVSAFISGPRTREVGDTRHNLPSHALVNITLIGQEFMGDFEIRGSVFNLFNQSYDDPAPMNTVPTDYPQEGTSYVLELRFSY